MTPLRIAFGDYELDEARFELRCGGEPVAVQPKVLDLVVYLARHRQRVVGKDELLEVVWKGVAVTEASLTQALSLARRALGDSSEAQHSIRTVRGKGFQFVAVAREPGARRLSARQVSVHDGATALETAEDDGVRAAEHGTAPHLFAALHCETPLHGGASWSLADVDEVHIGRGSRRRSERTAELTRLLTITIPGRLVSRRHARIVRSPSEWLVIDEGSRNGIQVNGERVESRALRPDDVIGCGKTLFRFSSEPQAGVEADADSRSGESLLGSITPRLRALERDLQRIAASDLSVCIAGESGTGKTHLARALHGLSGRRGALVKLEAATMSQADTALAFERARDGAVLIETIERIEPAMVASLVAMIESTPEARLLTTSIVPAAQLTGRVPADLLSRLSGYRCELPPLRERLGDLGVLAAGVLTGIAEPVELDLAAAEALLRHGWPGNIRELVHVLTGAATLAGGATIGREHLPEELRAPA